MRGWSMKAKLLICMFLLSLSIPAGCKAAKAVEIFPEDSKLVCLFLEYGYVNQYEVVRILPVIPLLIMI